MKTISTRQFNQSTSQAQKAAQVAPVFITHRGTPAYVLMTKAQYDKLTAIKTTPLDILMSLPDVGDVPLELPKRSLNGRVDVVFEG